jgi:flagellar M-ring protein FliF
MSDAALPASDISMPAPRVPAPGASGGTALAGVGGVVQSARNFMAQPAVVKSLPAIGLVAMLGLAALIWSVFSTAPSRTLFPGLADEDKAQVVEALRTANVPYSIDRQTGGVEVPEDQYYQARMLLAGQGLPHGGPSGEEMIDNLPLGASRAVESERIHGARELDLARTIEAIDAVQSARVHLAAETPSVFVRDSAQPSASVLLTLKGGRSLADGQVQAIVHLVASSVPGLSPDNVSVVDQNGRLLSHAGGDAATAASEQQLSVQGQVEDRYRQALATLLAPIVGPGNYTAEVHAEMDFSEVQSTREGFPANATAVTSEQTQRTSDTTGGAGAAGGIPGALSNQPPPASEVTAAPGGAVTPTPAGTPAAATSDGGRTTENVSRDFAVGREVSVTRQQVGTVKRVSVAIALRTPDGGRPRSQQEMQALEQLVKGAIGFDQSRGDVVALTSRPFASTEAPAQSWYEAAWISPIVRNVAAVLIALVVVFGLARPMLKKATRAYATRAEQHRAKRTQVGGEIASVLGERARTESDLKVSLEMIEATRDYEARAALIRNFVRQDPARAALVVRDLIRADAKQGA